MTIISLEGTTPDLHHTEDVAFSTLRAKIYFNARVEPRLTFPYLVKYVDLVDEHMLEFRGLDLKNGGTEFGRDPATTENFHVDLDNVAQCYRFSPCKLDDFNETNPYAILFLTDAYATATANAKIAAARGGPKWPTGSGDKLLTKVVKDLTHNYEIAMAAVDMILERGIDPGLAKEVRDLLAKRIY